jgi:hypothetical protein
VTRFFVALVLGTAVTVATIALSRDDSPTRSRPPVAVTRWPPPQGAKKTLVILKSGCTTYELRDAHGNTISRGKRCGPRPVMPPPFLVEQWADRAAEPMDTDSPNG